MVKHLPTNLNVCIYGGKKEILDNSQEINPICSLSYVKLVQFSLNQCFSPLGAYYHHKFLATQWKITTVNILENISGLQKKFQSASGQMQEFSKVFHFKPKEKDPLEKSQQCVGCDPHPGASKGFQEPSLPKAIPQFSFSRLQWKIMEKVGTDPLSIFGLSATLPTTIPSVKSQSDFHFKMLKSVTVFQLFIKNSSGLDSLSFHFSEFPCID